MLRHVNLLPDFNVLMIMNLFSIVFCLQMPYFFILIFLYELSSHVVGLLKICKLIFKGTQVNWVIFVLHGFATLIPYIKP